MSGSATANLIYQVNSDQVRDATDRLNSMADSTIRSATSSRELTTHFRSASQELSMLTGVMNDTGASISNTSQSLERLLGQLDRARGGFSISGNLLDPKQMAEFNAQGSALIMQAPQIATGLDRISQALQNQTQVGQQTRMMMRDLHVQLQDLRPEDVAQGLERVVERLRRLQDGTTKQSLVTTFFGPMSPGDYETLMHPAPVSVATQDFNKRMIEQQGNIAHADSATRELRRMNDNQDREWADMRQYFMHGLWGAVNHPFDMEGGGLNTQVLKRLNPQILHDLGPGSDYEQYGPHTEAGQVDLWKWELAHPKEARELGNLTVRGLARTAEQGWFGRWLHHVQPIAGPDGRPTLGPDGVPVRNSEADSYDRYITEFHRNERRHMRPYDQIGSYLTAGKEHFLNAFNLYTPPEGAIPKGGETPELDLQQAQAAIADRLMRLGDPSRLQQFSLTQSLKGWDDPSVLKQLQTATGDDTEGHARFNQVKNYLEYQKNVALNPMAPELTSDAMQNFVARHPLNDQAFASFAGNQLASHFQELPTEWERRGNTINDLMDRHGSTPQSQVRDINEAWQSLTDMRLKGIANQRRFMEERMGRLKGVASESPSVFGEQSAYIDEYMTRLPQQGPLVAGAAGKSAYDKHLEDLRVAATRGLADEGETAQQAARVRATALGDYGSRTELMSGRFSTQLQNQLEGMKWANSQTDLSGEELVARRKARDESATSLGQDLQGRRADLQDQQQINNAMEQRADLAQRLREQILATSQGADAMAKALGDPQATEQVEKLVRDLTDAQEKARQLSLDAQNINFRNAQEADTAFSRQLLTLSPREAALRRGARPLFMENLANTEAQGGAPLPAATPPGSRFGGELATDIQNTGTTPLEIATVLGRTVENALARLTPANASAPTVASPAPTLSQPAPAAGHVMGVSVGAAPPHPAAAAPSDGSRRGAYTALAAGATQGNTGNAPFDAAANSVVPATEATAALQNRDILGAAGARSGGAHSAIPYLLSGQTGLAQLARAQNSAYSGDLTSGAQASAQTQGLLDQFATTLAQNAGQTQVAIQQEHEMAAAYRTSLAAVTRLKVEQQALNEARQNAQAAATPARVQQLMSEQITQGAAASALGTQSAGFSAQDAQLQTMFAGRGPAYRNLGQLYGSLEPLRRQIAALQASATTPADHANIASMMADYQSQLTSGVTGQTYQQQSSMSDAMKQLYNQNELNSTILSFGPFASNRRIAQATGLVTARQQLQQQYPSIPENSQMGQNFIYQTQMNDFNQRQLQDVTNLRQGFLEFGSAASNAFTQALTSGRTFGVVLQGMLRDITSMTMRMTLDPLLQSAMVGELPFGIGQQPTPPGGVSASGAAAGGVQSGGGGGFPLLPAAILASRMGDTSSGMGGGTQQAAAYAGGGQGMQGGAMGMPLMAAGAVAGGAAMDQGGAPPMQRPFIGGWFGSGILAGGNLVRRAMGQQPLVHTPWGTVMAQSDYQNTLNAMPVSTGSDGNTLQSWGGMGSLMAQGNPALLSWMGVAPFSGGGQPAVQPWGQQPNLVYGGAQGQNALNDLSLTGRAGMLGYSAYNALTQPATAAAAAGAVGATAGAGASAAAASSAMADTLAPFILPFATGGAFVNGRVDHAFATGGLIDRPVTFHMAHGAVGQAGEVGTEAILPLRRMPNGNLGVIASGASNGGPNVTIHVNSPVHVHGAQVSPAGKMNPRAASQMQAGIHDHLTNAFRSLVAQELRPGGILYQATGAGPNGTPIQGFQNFQGMFPV